MDYNETPTKGLIMDKKLATKITIGTILVVNIALAVTANVKSRREFKKLVEACAEISK